MNAVVKSFVKWMVRLALLGVLVVACVLAYLDFHGFPPALVRAVERQFAQLGYRCRFGAIHFDWMRGVVATDMTLADAKAPEQTLARVDEVQLQINWTRLAHRQNAINALRIANANLSVPTPPDEVGPAQFTASGAYATVWFGDDGTILIDQLIGVYCGINLRVHGSVKPRAVAESPPEKPPAGPGQFTFVTKVLRELNSLEAATPPQLDLDFDLDLAAPLAGRAEVRLTGADVSYRRLLVESLAVRVTMKDGAIEIVRCDAVAGGGGIAINGRYDIGEGQFDLRLNSTLHPVVIAPALPAGVAAALRDVRVGQSPRIVARYWLSPETGSLPKLEGTVDLPELEFRGVNFRLIHAAVENQGPELVIPEAQIVMAEGRLTGHGRYHIESSDFEYEFDSTLNPRKLLVLMPRGVQQFVEPSWFDQSPHITAQVTGDFVDPEAFAYDADVTLGRCAYRGVPLRAGAGKVRLRRNRLDVRNLSLFRDEGDVRGGVAVDFNRNRVAFDLQMTADPSAMAPMLGPKAAQIMQPFRFGPRTLGTAKGVADFAQSSATAWTAEFANSGFTGWSMTADQAHGVLTFTNDVLHINADGRGLKGWGMRATQAQANIVVTTNAVRATSDTLGFGWWKLTTDHARADLTFSNQTLRVDNFDSDLYGGKLRGWGVFDFTAPAAYQLGFDAQRCDVEKTMAAIRETPGRPITGFLTGHAELQGTGDDLATLRGAGRLQVSDGVLWEAPLFGPISALLGKTKATDAVATFTVGQRTVKTDALRIAAGAFTAQSHGQITFDGDLDFRVRAQFMNSWPGLNILTTILGKILEYKVGGSLADPSYRPVNLPKELLPHD